MTPPTETTDVAPAKGRKKKSMAHWIGVGLVLGVFCGLFFGEYCAPLQTVGLAYVGLLQMTVLPYLVLSLVAKTGRLDLGQARKLGLVALAVLLVFWVIAILLIVLVSGILPAIEGAAFFSPQVKAAAPPEDLLLTFIPTNVFRSLTNEYIPAVVVFCLFFGSALMLLPGKEPLLDFLDLCSAAIGQINTFLVRLAPVGLFTLTAAAAGTLHLQEMFKLQAYLIMFTLACLVATFGVLPVLVSSLTHIRYRELLQAAEEPMLTAIATGKLFVVLPQVSDKCEQLLKSESETDGGIESTASVLVPLAYPFPHIGKILGFVFISFAAWYTGAALSPGQTAQMAATGAGSSFASPLITIPYLLDKYQLPQDMMALFILPGFITMRIADVVGVMHLMALTVIVSETLQRRLRVRWKRLVASVSVLLVCLGVAGITSRAYLASNTLAYDLDKRFLSLEVAHPAGDYVVFRTRHEVPKLPLGSGSTLDRIRSEKVLRVGYNPDHLPYSFFNQQQQLVGLDVELMHELAEDLKVRLEFVPQGHGEEELIEQLESGEFDVMVGGIMIKPERLLLVGLTQPYQMATMSVVVPDYRRKEFDTWNDPDMTPGVRLGAVQEDVAAAARENLPSAQIAVIDSIHEFFAGKLDVDGLILPAEEGAAWSVLYPQYSVVVPQDIIQRPVGMAVRSSDTQWLSFLNRWLDYERSEGALDRLRKYWIEGGGTKEKTTRWCILRDALHWVE